MSAPTFAPLFKLRDDRLDARRFGRDHRVLAPSMYLLRHVSGDFGATCAEDWGNQPRGDPRRLSHPVGLPDRSQTAVPGFRRELRLDHPQRLTGASRRSCCLPNTEPTAPPESSGGAFFSRPNILSKHESSLVTGGPLTGTSVTSRHRGTSSQARRGTGLATGDRRGRRDRSGAAAAKDRPPWRVRNERAGECRLSLHPLRTDAQLYSVTGAYGRSGAKPRRRAVVPSARSRQAASPPFGLPSANAHPSAADAASLLTDHRYHPRASALHPKRQMAFR